MERPAFARLTLWGGSRNVFVVNEPPIGLEVALHKGDADLEVLRLESQDNYGFVPSLLVVFTNDQERAERALGLADERLEAVQARLAVEHAAAIPF